MTDTSRGKKNTYNKIHHPQQNQVYLVKPQKFRGSKANRLLRRQSSARPMSRSGSHVGNPARGVRGIATAVPHRWKSQKEPENGRISVFTKQSSGFQGPCSSSEGVNLKIMWVNRRYWMASQKCSCTKNICKTPK